MTMEEQYGIRWPTGSVFAYGSRGIAEKELARDGRGVGVLVVCEYEPGMPNATPWHEVTRRMSDDLMAECSAPSENADLTGVYCQLPEGHDGDHEAMVPLAWPSNQ